MVCKGVLTALLLAGLVCVAGCRPNTPLRVSTIQTGRTLNSDRSVGQHTTRFKPDDTIHVAVLTDGPGAGAITVRWRFRSSLVSEETQKVSYYTNAATEFHITNSSGFPEGDYTAEILVDDKPFATRTMSVVK